MEAPGPGAGDGHRRRNAEIPLPGDGRHFSWAILEQVDEAEAPSRGVSGGRPLGLKPPLLDAETERNLSWVIREGTDPATGQKTPEAQAAIEQLILANMRLCIRPARSAHSPGQQFDDIVQQAMVGLLRAAEKFDGRMGARFSTYAMFWIRQAIARGDASDGRLIRIPVHILDIQKKLSRAIWHGSIDEGASLDEAARATGADQAEIAAARSAYMSVVGFDEVEEDLQGSWDQDPWMVEIESAEADDLRCAWVETVSTDALSSDHEPLIMLSLDLLRDLPLREREVITLYYGIDDSDEFTLEEIGEVFGLTRERVRQIRNSALQSLREAILRERLTGSHSDADLGLSRAWANRLHEHLSPMAAKEARRHGRAWWASEDDSAQPTRRVGPSSTDRVDPLVERRRDIRSALAALRQSTSSITWFPSPPASDPDHLCTTAIEAVRGVLKEPFARTELIETLAALGSEVSADVIADANKRLIFEEMQVAICDGWPESGDLHRLLRIAHFLGVSEKSVLLEVAIRTAPPAEVLVDAGLCVTSTWHYDENNPEHVRTRNQLHELGDRLGLIWKDRFDGDVGLVIAQSLDHRSKKTLEAHQNGVGVCDISNFLGATAGSMLAVIRAPGAVPRTFSCRRCTRVLIVPLHHTGRLPQRCDECSTSPGGTASALK